ncbi:MAG: S9 family peptidase [Maricaulaceae bacterium]|jgi:dipeptidyl-peptidase-4
MRHAASIGRATRGLVLAAACISCTTAALPPVGEALTPDRLNADPSLSGASPRGLSFSPDGGRLAFLRGRSDDAQVQDLWVYDLETGQERLLVDSDLLTADPTELSEAERARRERQRIRATGIVEYEWNDVGEAILAPLNGDLFYVDLSGAEPTVRQLTQTDADEIDAKISPAGGYVSFVRDQSLFVIDLETGREHAIATSEAPEISYGAAEFVAQEEMGRTTGYWWSPDDSRIAYARVDEGPVDIVERVDINADGSTVVAQRYPRAGATNAEVRLFVHDLASDARIEVDLGPDPDIYLNTAAWLGDTLTVQRQNRDQTRVDLLAVDGVDGSTTTLLSEADDAWVNVGADPTPLADGASFLWTSERSGFRHLYLYNADGSLVRQVTSGGWPVAGDGVVEVNEDAGLVYFRGGKDTPLERHLYVTSYLDDNAEPRRLTTPGSTWGVAMNEAATAFVGTSSNPDQPPQVGLYGIDGGRIRWIEENALDEDHPYTPYLARHTPPTFGTIEAEDGTPLYYSLVVPPQCTAASPCPAIVEVYGGPGVQRVARSWSSTTQTQMLAQRGYVVFQLDNRGAAGRGHAFEAVLHRRMGDVEVRDQLAGLAFLKGLDAVDADRVGVRGWSYGGYMVLQLMSQAPEAFAVGVSGAPVSDWALYDTHYTERYLDTPADNPEGYEASAVFPYLENLSRPLLLIHGMADDNVVFENSTRVMRVLQDAGTPFETMVYPGERHGIYSPGPRRHMTNAWVDFFDRHLKPDATR